MTSLRRALFFFLLAGVFVFPASSFSAEGFEYRWIPVGLQVATTVSGGAFSLDEVVDAANETGLSALIVTDRDMMRWEYGVWPFRRLLKGVVEKPSVSTYGIDKYLQAIEFHSKKHPDLILIPGTETAPFYYWKGSPLTRSLKLFDGHRHILVVGLTDPHDYRDLPVVSRPSSIRRALRWHDVFRLFPFALITLGVLSLFRRRRIVGAAAVLLGVLFLTNESPFHPLGYDQFSRNAGYRPYQRLIEYVHARGGLTFWSYPEALVETSGYTGFSIFPEGYKVAGQPGGEWDDVLIAYCRGAREEPVWAVAGMSFDHGTPEELRARMRGTRTYVLADALNWHDVLEAMRKGRMYATVGGRDEQILLRDYSIMDSSTGQRAGPGREFVIAGSAIVTLTADVEGEEEAVPVSREDAIKDVKVKVIRNGAVIKEDDLALPLRFIFVDPEPLSEKTFYRVLITRGAQIIATNPIFVEPQGI